MLTFILDLHKWIWGSDILGPLYLKETVSGRAEIDASRCLWKI